MHPLLAASVLLCRSGLAGGDLCLDVHLRGGRGGLDHGLCAAGRHGGAGDGGRGGLLSNLGLDGHAALRHMHPALGRRAGREGARVDEGADAAGQAIPEAVPTAVDRGAAVGAHAHARRRDEDRQQVLDGSPDDEAGGEVATVHVLEEVREADLGAARAARQRHRVDQQLKHGARRRA